MKRISLMEDFILVIKNAVPDATCDALIELAESPDSLQRATIFDKEGKIGVDTARKNAQLCLTVDNCGPHLQVLDEAFRHAYVKYISRYEPLGKVGKIKLEGFTLLRYERQADFYDWHCDALQPNTRSRFLSQVAYLNHVKRGGETEFFFQKTKVRPLRGAIVVFPSSWTHPHRARPPKSGKKYAVTNFLRYPGPTI